MIKYFNLLLFLIYITLDPAYAIITCEAEDNNSSIARNGHFTYDRTRLDISFETELKVEQIYSSITICGERTWNIDPLPNCTSVDTSYENRKRLL